MGKLKQWMFKNKSLEIHFGFKSITLEYTPWFYFDSRPLIHIEFLFFSLFFHLPFRRKKHEDKCVWPCYGFGFKNPYGGNYANTLFLFLGKKTILYSLPWRLIEFKREELPPEEHPFYHYSIWVGLQKVKATLKIEKFYQRPYWFQWTSIFQTYFYRVNIEYDVPVGDDKATMDYFIVNKNQNIYQELANLQKKCRYG